MNRWTTLHEAYLRTLADVYDNPDHIAEPRGQRTREKLDYKFSITNPVPEAIVTNDPERNQVIADYTAKETELYNSCANTAEAFGKASKFWLKLANPDGTVNSAYGHLIWQKQSLGNLDFEFGPFTQDFGPGLEKELAHRSTGMRTPWEWARESLQKDKDTRQAILRFSLPEHQWMGNKDQTCTMHGNFLIRDNKLNLTITMRSNDLTLGLVYDLPWFISLMYKMQEALANTYPDLGIGTYTHIVHSLHIYDRDEDKILRMLGRK